MLENLVPLNVYFKIILVDENFDLRKYNILYFHNLIVLERSKN